MKILFAKITRFVMIAMHACACAEPVKRAANSNFFYNNLVVGYFRDSNVAYSGQDHFSGAELESRHDFRPSPLGLSLSFGLLRLPNIFALEDSRPAALSFGLANGLVASCRTSAARSEATGHPGAHRNPFRGITSSAAVVVVSC